MMPQNPAPWQNDKMRLLSLLLLLLATPAGADPARILDATASPNGEGWSFAVTLTHPDTGCDHYADGWRIETSDGTVLGLRDLAHPHVDEQPFIRSLAGVVLPMGLTEVLIRPRCNLEGWATETYLLSLP